MVIETNRMPYTITRHQNNVQAIDIYTRMLENRIIFLDEEINTDVASSIIAQTLVLQNVTTSATLRFKFFLILSIPISVV